QFGYCLSSFVVLGLVVGRTPLASPLQKNQLATPPPSCRCSAGVGTFCSYCGSACYCCCARYKAVAVPVFENIAISRGYGFLALAAGRKKPGSVTDEPGFCYGACAGVTSATRLWCWICGAGYPGAAGVPTGTCD